MPNKASRRRHTSPQHFTRRNSSLVSKVAQKIGLVKRTLSTKDKQNYTSELQRIYRIIKKQKHNPNKTLTLADLHEVSPVYIVDMLSVIQRKYSWSIVYSVPRSETPFLKAVIRVIHRLLDVTDLTERLDNKHKHKPSPSTQHSTRTHQCAQFLALCRLADVPIGQPHTTFLAPSDDTLKQPFWKAYIAYAKQHKKLLQTLLKYHMIHKSCGLLCRTHRAYETNQSGHSLKCTYDPATSAMQTAGGHNVLHRTTYKHTDILIVDGVMGVLQPFGITVFQREMMQSQLTTLCMCLSKRSCTAPCAMSKLTCTYVAGGVAGTKADITYVRKLFIQTTKEFFSLTVVPVYMCYAYFPIVEDVFGKVDVVKMTKKLQPLFKMIAMPQIGGFVFTHFLNLFSIRNVNKYINVRINLNTLGVLVFAPIFEEIICRGMIASGFKKLLKIFPIPTTTSKRQTTPRTKTKAITTAKTTPPKASTTRRRSSTFEDMIRDDDMTDEEMNTWREWLTILFVSLLFGALHTLSHSQYQQEHMLLRQIAFIQVLLCTVGGFGLHTLAIHRGLHVAMLNHFFHNFLCMFINITPSPQYLKRNGIKLV